MPAPGTDGTAMDRQACTRLDAQDPLAGVRACFSVPAGSIYLDGNSLGALQPAVTRRVRAALDEWGDGLIRSWNDARWVDLPQRVATRLAPLLGARPDEVAVTDSTSVNLFKVLLAARRLRPDRRVILTDASDFPTDRYVAGGVADLAGCEVRTVARDAVVDAIDETVAVVALTHVDYRTGAVHDAEAVGAAARAAGALTCWDLSHSTGALVVDLASWGADVAVGCTYKYLSGGPGAPAYLYVARRHHEGVESPIRGWFGHAAPFDFDDRYVPGCGADRFLAGTPAVLSLAALDAALGVWDGIARSEVEAKARALTETFVELVGTRCEGLGLELASPRDPACRGAQVSLRHPQAHAIMQALIGRGVIGDFRPPDLLRFGFAPLYVRHVDVWDAVDALADLLVTGDWDRPEHHERRTVT